MEIGVASVNPSDAVLPHQGCRVGIVSEIAGQLVN